jgi:hypothetical protein
MAVNTWAVSRQNQHNGFATNMDPDKPAHPLLNILTSKETDSEQNGSWSDCADAQAGLDPCWSRTHYDGFVVTRLKYIFIQVEKF